MKDISYNLVDGIFKALDDNITITGVTYPVYKSIPKTPALTYVYVGGVIAIENGTKDDFLYEGTIQVQVIDVRGRGDKKLAQNISGVVRNLLKPQKASTFQVGTDNLIVFSLESSTEFVEYEEGQSKVTIADIYNFLIE